MDQLSSPLLAFLFALTAMLSAIAIVDFREQRIPDALNLLLGGVGVMFQMNNNSSGFWESLIFAFAATGGFWLVRRVHTQVTGRVGLGLGDVKMAGASAFWLTPMSFPIFLLISSLSALLYLGGRAATNGDLGVRQPIPFGPFLALGLLSTWILDEFAIVGFMVS